MILITIIIKIMKPINFKESTNVSRPTSEAGGVLPYWSDGKQNVSKWKPTFIERIRIAFGAPIWVGILSGKRTPAMWVDATTKKMFNYE